METMLKKLFDYQAFEQESTLQKVIDSVHSRYQAEELSLDEMDMLYAAGTPETMLQQTGKKKK